MSAPTSPLPPVRSAPALAQRPRSTGSDYAQLIRQVRGLGLLRRRRRAYAALIAVTISLFAACWAAVVTADNTWWQLLIAIAMGIASTQVAFLGHDGGHQQVFASRRANDRFGRLTGNLLVGVSYGWWVGKHNRHHANPNRAGHDPDIGEGVLAFTLDQVHARTGRLSRLIAGRQAWLFFPLLPFEGFNLHVASVRALWPGAARSSRGGSRRTEMLLLGAHLGAYLAVLLAVMSPARAVAFVLVHQAVFGLHMGCSFAPNHKGMPIVAADEELDFLRRQVITSRNVRGGWLTSWALGGLNFQIEHHLFPNMPRSSLRRAQPVVREFCRERGIGYTETSLAGSYRAVLRHLNAVGAPLRDPAARAGLNTTDQRG